MGSGKRPRASTHLVSSAITIMRSEAAATIFSRSSAPPPPLIRLSARIHFIGAVDGEVEPVDLVQRGQRNFAGFGLDAGRFRGRHPHHLQPGGDLFAQQIDKMLRGRTGAEPELHAVPDMLQGLRRRQPFQCVHIHVQTMPLEGTRRGFSSVVSAPGTAANAP